MLGREHGLLGAFEIGAWGRGLDMGNLLIRLPYYGSGALEDV